MVRLAVALLIYLQLPVVANAQTRDEIAIVQSVFAQLQGVSIQEDAEYCGYLGRNRSGRLVATEATQGAQGSCLSQFPHELETIVASYHTHGAHSVAFYKELPSGSDVRGDLREGINGYIATPGGRLWYVDISQRRVSQLCGIGCLPRDSRFVAGQLGVVAPSYSFEQLNAVLGN